MSIRQSLRAVSALSSTTRSFASSSRVLVPPITPGPPPDPNASSGFDLLINNLLPPPTSSAKPVPALRYGSPSSHTPEAAAAVRGYTPEALPPQIDPLLDLFTNMLMKHGRKAEAQGHVSDILSMLQKASNSPPQPLLSRAITLASPSVRLNSTRRRAKLVQTPKALDERQSTRQGIVWLLKAAERGRKGGLPRNQRIAREVFAVLEGSSDVYKWVEERHRLATANRSNLGR